MANEAKNLTEKPYTDMNKVLAIKKVLYTPGAWNNFKPIEYDFDDVKKNSSKKLLNQYAYCPSSKQIGRAHV